MQKRINDMVIKLLLLSSDKRSYKKAMPAYVSAWQQHLLVSEIINKLCRVGFGPIANLDRFKVAQYSGLPVQDFIPDSHTLPMRHFVIYYAKQLHEVPC